MQTERTKELGKGAEDEVLVPSVHEYMRIHICAHLKINLTKLSICDNFTAVKLFNNKGGLSVLRRRAQMGKNLKRTELNTALFIVMCESGIVMVKIL